MSESNAPLIEAPKSSKGPIIAAVVVVLAVIAAILIFKAVKGDDEETAGAQTVKIGVVGKAEKHWPLFVEAAKKENINVELVDFTDYLQANPALANGELDLNQFQHLAFLGEYNVTEKKDLIAIGATAIYPMALFSEKTTAVADFKDGATIAVPDDGSNQARALGLLQQQGLITLKDGGTVFSTLADIDTAASKVKVTQLPAEGLPNALPDVDGAVINNDYVVKAELDYNDALATDDPSEPGAAPYINVFAARAEDKDNATYRKLVEIYQNTPAVTDAVKEVYGDQTVFPQKSTEELQEILDKVQKDAAARK